MFHAIRFCPVPVIGRINGAAVGGGSGLVSCCDFSFAVNSATFGFTEVKLGIMPAVISKFVMEKIGKNNCSRYFLTGERLSAKRAAEIGLIQEALDNEQKMDETIAGVVDELSKNSPAAVHRCKVLIEEVSHMSITNSKGYVASEIAKARVSAEGQEGLSSFLEKRKPNYVKKW